MSRVPPVSHGGRGNSSGRGMGHEGGNRLHMVTGKSGCLGGISLVKGDRQCQVMFTSFGTCESAGISQGGGNVKSCSHRFESCESARYIGHVVSQVVRGIGQERRKQV